MKLSICIPSYNRPTEIKRFLQSIDCPPEQVEIVIAEDKAPLREEVRRSVEDFRKTSPYKIVYHENPENLGYDGNFRRLIELSSGEFVLFMGDDDKFYPGGLDQFLSFVGKHPDAGYILRSYYGEHPDGTLELFKYFKEEREFKPGLETACFLFKRTVSISGLTFKRESALRAATEEFDGTLLYQLHLVLEIAYREKTVFCPIPAAIAVQTFRDDKPNFGASKKESKFQPGKVTASNSIAFTEGFFEISKAFDKRHGTDISKMIQKDLSKYSYPILSIQRKNGAFNFLKYSVNLAKKTKINVTWHYYFYTAALFLFGERICDSAIVYIKNKLGFTPHL